MANNEARIMYVTFKRLCNTGNWENFTIEAACAVPDGGDSHDAKATALYVQSFVDTLCLERIQAGKRGRHGGMDAGEVDDLP